MINPNTFLSSHSWLFFGLLLQTETVETHHGKSKTGANAIQTHPAWCRGIEFKSGCEQRVYPIYIFKTRVISSMKKLARTKWHHIANPGIQGCNYNLVNHDFTLVLNPLLKIVLIKQFLSQLKEFPSLDWIINKC